MAFNLWAVPFQEQLRSTAHNNSLPSDSCSLACLKWTSNCSQISFCKTGVHAIMSPNWQRYWQSISWTPQNEPERRVSSLPSPSGVCPSDIWACLLMVQKFLSHNDNRTEEVTFQNSDLSFAICQAHKYTFSLPFRMTGVSTLLQMELVTLIVTNERGGFQGSLN